MNINTIIELPKDYSLSKLPGSCSNMFISELSLSIRFSPFVISKITLIFRRLLILC